MKELLAYFDGELPGINAFLEEEARKLNGLVSDVALHILGSGGKRIRPMLTILTARALGYDRDDYLPMACALELLHSATLLHDDYLDDADMRRGSRAAHLVFGRSETILAGDALLALANEMGARYGKARLSAVLAKGIMDTAAGEIEEIGFSRNPALDRETYMDIIIGKTARLIETACRCGAVLATDDAAMEEAAAEYGLNLGIAFQLVDDALDYVSPSSETGKPEGGDLKEGKVTLPLILLMEQADEVAAEELLDALRERRLSAEQCTDIVTQVRDGGYADRTRDEAAAYVQKAKDALGPFPDCPELTVLRQAAEYVLTRTK
ncbi:polyprenyl synthetase family protein [Pseudodesulfovibrio senegalensis]|jgi:octaprenyl-diphosphate synthase|uniref:Polyprenyl synthetase family protein n=1 Tax=Pseudodesulfovibrio senegalensis TaxID=1721087 RepID=A0A6N6N3F9_9BACT|nr:polyprenyl synthetase family protein [Pseudodesulfovibrio senegalensis]KAB1442722.1 polyprenyl synthetase family protein [Pseudodesulfovibrio senegalensis]